MKELYIKHMASTLEVAPWQVENTVRMMEEGDTVPFISRYRKERTGGLDDALIATIKHLTGVFGELEKRKSTVLETIESLGKLTDALKAEIENCVDPARLEDLYLPYRPKRRTRATVARENGLEPLADAMFDFKLNDPAAEAHKYLGDKLASVEDALAGARDIIAERISETAEIRDAMRLIFSRCRVVSKPARGAADKPEAAKYRSYFNFSMPVQRIPAHNLLAILRAQGEGLLSVSIDADPEKCCSKIYYEISHGKRYPSPALQSQIKEAVSDCYERLLEPSISGETLREAKRKADTESIEVFGENLRQLLLSSPVGQKRTLAIDPGFRNGCKLAALDAHGNLLHHSIIYPHPPRNEKVRALMEVQDILEKYEIQAVAIGNGTAARETEEFMRKVQLPEGCKVWTVSEDGASIYSASEIAREEFPDEDVTVRGAVSIGRRLMDPLSELVKIDPKSLGIGQYQHDVDQSLLKEKLDSVVESCVNSVGVDVNIASPSLLRYVAGIGPVLADNIVAWRTSHGGFASRKDLMDVPRLGPAAFKQSAGFLRINGASNPLDSSAVHPESYHIAEKMASSLGVPVSSLVGNKELCSKLKARDFVEKDFGLPTVNDIISELQSPGRDPRQEASEFEFASDIHEIEDLHPGMELPGIVTNITNFGAFVDIGLHENGLIHVSRMGRGRGADPSKILKLHQQIKVQVEDIDVERRRIALRLLS